MDQRRPFLLIAWALLLGLFAWTILPILSPLILFLALVYLLTPLFGTDLYRRLIVTLGALTFLWLLHVAGSFLAPFALALVLAYVANPLVNRLESSGVRRTWGALGVLLTTVLLIAIAGMLIVPLVVEQGTRFVEDLPEMIEGAQSWYRAQITGLANSRIPIIRDIQFERALEVDSEDVVAYLSRQIEALGISWENAIGLGRGLQTALTILGYLILTPVLTFYLLRDFPSLQEWVSRVVPRDRRDRTLAFLRRYDKLVGEFLRGQLLVALLVGIATGVGFWLVGFPNAVLLGVVAGVFNVVPYLGLVVSLVPALLIALLTPPLWFSILKVAGVFFAVQSLEAYFLSPKIIGDRVGLHPVWVMLAILAFGSFFGIIGLLLAIPLAVLIKLLIVNTVATYKKSVYYRQAETVRDDEAV
ncbi:MAG TPA: AI-2E family transporter [Gemmatimonadota bacterium]|nr:AI-2E family transporter [Gemmatimonadota bacterium]